MNDTQDMQDVLVSLKNAITTMNSSFGSNIQNLETLLDTKYFKYLSGSYVGNGQTNIRVPWPSRGEDDLSEVKFVIVYSVNTNNNHSLDFACGIGANNGILCYGSKYNNYNQVDCYQMFLDDPQYCFKVATEYSNYNINYSGVTYNYILLG